MELNKNKRVGKILFIVEGGKHEFSLIKRIFGDILGYKRIEKRRTKATYYVSQTDNHSVVAVINTETPNIESINEKEYLERIYEELIEQHSFDVANAAVYYIFDRDSKSNKNTALILELIKNLKNARENDNNMMGGMLILSYPAIEAYEVSNFVKDSYKMEFCIGADVKSYIAQNAQIISMNKISEETILHACNELEEYMIAQGIEMDIDDYGTANMKIFEEEENYYSNTEKYYLLSMMSCVMIDLGIIQMKKDEV